MSTELINQVLELTNVERTNAGLQPLKLDSQLVDAAQDHSTDMAKDDFFDHTGVDGSTPASRVKANGYEYSTTGENIAAGQTTAAAVVESWMNSPGHRANILNPDFTEIGIGYEYLENDTGSVNYNHYWTQVFGTPLNNNSPDSNSDSPTPESNDPAAVEEMETSEQSSPVEETTSDNLLEESDLDTVEESNDPAAVEEIETSEQSSPVEETTSDNLLEESDLNTVEESSDSDLAAVEEIETSEQSSPVEDTNDDGLDLNKSVSFEMKHTGDINGKTRTSVLAGTNDAIDFMEYLEQNFDLKDTHHNSSHDCQLQIESWLGMAAEANGDYDAMDIAESDLNSIWTECKQDFMQEVSDSFL